MKKKLLIYSSDKGGHYPEYINYLIRFLTKNDLLVDVHFLLHPELKPYVLPFKNVKYIEGEILSSSSFRHPLQRGFSEWHLIEKGINQEAFSRILFLNLDPFIALVGSSKFKKLNIEVDGIYFLPFFGQNDKIRNVKDVFRHMLYRFNMLKLTSNKNVKNIFILNDEKPVSILNQMLGLRPCFYYLVDPVTALLNSGSSSEYGNNIENEKNNLLIFGSFDVRKNVLGILDALSRLPSNYKEKINLLIYGKPMSSYENELKGRIKKFVEKEELISVDSKLEFIDENKLDDIFYRADLILIPYLNFYSSSGILGWAAKYDKLVLAPKEGLIGRLVNEYKLGLCVNPKSPQEISESIIYLLDNMDDLRKKSRGGKYINERTVNQFCSTLLRDWIE